MCTISRICLAGILLLCMTPSVVGQGGPTNDIKEKGFTQETRATLQKVLESIVSNPEHPFVGGISAAIKIEGVAFWQGAAGYAARKIDAQNNLLAGGTPFTTGTLSRIYSITKSMTAALVLQLADEGYFSLSDPISKYMPYMGLFNPELNPSVTIQQLLNHESGYSDWEDNINLQIAIAAQPTHKWTPYELMVYTDQVFAPGTDREYSHNNYVFLGAIIEAVTGKKVEQVYRERFFTPLGLKSMYFAGREENGARKEVAAPHDNIGVFNQVFAMTGQPLYPMAYTNISRFPFTAIETLDFTGGGIISNVADVAEWGSALFNGRATSKKVLDAMLTSIATTPDQYGNRLGYGLKGFKQITGAYDFIGHNGSAPGYRSIMLYHPQTKMTLVVLTNFAGMSPYEIAKALYEAFPKEIACGNGNKADKVWLCYNGNMQCVDQSAAAALIDKGATLGACDPASLKEVPGADLRSGKLVQLRAHPNPVDNRTVFSFVPEQSGQASLRLYDMTGVLKAVLFEGEVEKGVQKQVTMERGSLTAGVYFARLQTATGISQHKVVLNR